MKRYLMPILVAILAIGIIFEVSCDSSQQRIAELEEQVAALTQQVKGLTAEDASPTWVLEDDVEVEVIYGNKNPNWIPFDLNVGDRVEGEVSVSHAESIVLGEVRDPYGNIVVQTSHITFQGEYRRNSGFPWRFAFIAYKEGKYQLGVFSFATLQGGQPSAHLKITRYEHK